MRTRRAAILLSAALHAVLAVALALLRSPGGTPPVAEAALVRLRFPPPEPAATAVVAPAGPTPAASSAEAPRGRTPTQAPAPTTTPARPAATAPAVRTAAEEPRPSIGDLSAVYSRSEGEGALAPLPSDPMAGTPAPRGSPAPAARFTATGQAPLSRAPPPTDLRSPAGPTPVASPAIRPDPQDLLREMQRPDSPDGGGTQAAETRAAEGTVEPVVSASGRSLSAQPPMAFPAGLLAEGREADVTIRIQIRADGSVLPREVTRSSGDPAVDSAVERIVRGYLFNAVDGATIVEGTVTFHFRLKRGF
jgi:TonB family protein